VQEAIAKIKPSLRGTDVLLLDISGGVVKLKILTSSCGSGIPKEMAIEILEEQLKEELPEIEEVIAE
jgi:Fe-S cluster biogenesis protein NfuA